MTKAAKTPPITSKTKLLSFDLETNGLHGQAFAIGALVIDASSKVYDEFTARIPVEGELDAWVAHNVLPSLDDMPVTHKSYKELRDAFWRWYIIAEPNSDYVLVDNGYPVEYRFLLDCQGDDIHGRYWQHPFPCIDLSSLLLTLGGETTKKQLQSEVAAKQGPFRPHHPLDDAQLSALMAFVAFQKAGRLRG
jgi:hypothetical protein